MRLRVWSFFFLARTSAAGQLVVRCKNPSLKQGSALLSGTGRLNKDTFVSVPQFWFENFPRKPACISATNFLH
jgi:hypothetical protein